MNLTFAYTGTASIVGPVYPLGGVGAFGADSLGLGVDPGGQYTSSTHKENPGHPDHDTPQANQGYVVHPVNIPETSSLMLMLPALLPLGMVLRGRLRK